jgi:hypothetical protein
VLPAAFVKSLSFAAPDRTDGMLATYMAMMDYYNFSQRLSVIDYLMSRFYSGDTGR